MYKINPQNVGRVAATAVLSMGLSVGAISVASAAAHGTHGSVHSSLNMRTIAFQGTITAVSSTSVTVLNAKGTSSTFTIATTTKVLGGKHVTPVPTLALGQRVVVRALASAPTIATQITIEGTKPATKSVGAFVFRGDVTAVSTTSVTVLNAKGTSSTFTIATTTKVLGGSSKATPPTVALDQRVVVHGWKSAPTVASRITIEAAK